jgi:DNA (cytosine-5)-methyltransferase 1
MTRKLAAEFFAGIGLVRMALERAGWSVRLANDIDEKKAQIYRDNFGDQHFHLGDIKEIQADQVPNVQLATASFPCIDLSLAGNRNGLGGRYSSAYWEFQRIVGAMRERRPKLVLLENVVGLLSSNRGDDLRSIVVSLNKLGYVCDLLAVDAVHFVPQSRPRLFVVGVRDRKVSDVIPHEARPHQVLQFIHTHDDLKWASVPLPPLPPKRRDLGTLMERLKPDAAEWWDRRRRAHLYAQMSARHRALLQALMESSRYQFATVYKRMRPAGCRAELRADGVAGCLRTPRGGSSKQFLVVAGNGSWRVRNMTAREYARLQGVPDSFNISVPYLQALSGFGDAVCVPAVEWVVRSCLGNGHQEAARL